MFEGLKEAHAAGGGEHSKGEHNKVRLEVVGVRCSGPRFRFGFCSTCNGRHVNPIS